MSVMKKTLSIFNKKTVKWTGLLQRMLREFISETGFRLEENDLKNLYAIPDALIDLGQAGVLEAVALEAGRDCLCVTISYDPTSDDDLDLSMLMLYDFADERLKVNLIINDPKVAKFLRADKLKSLSTKNLKVSIWKFSDQTVNSSATNKNKIEMVSVRRKVR